jgi:hypothetical protein
MKFEVVMDFCNAPIQHCSGEDVICYEYLYRQGSQPLGQYLNPPGLHKYKAGAPTT